MHSTEKIRVLTTLISVIEALQNRFEGRGSINQLKGALYTHREMLKGKQITATGIAKLSGVSKSTISNCFQSIPHIFRHGNPHDDRSKLVTIDDISKRTDYLIDVAKVWQTDAARCNNTKENVQIVVEQCVQSLPVTPER